MEGKFLTRPQRLKVAEQVKKTHFSMGTESYVYSTTSKQCLKAPNDRSQESINLSKQMKRPNIAFGNEKKVKVSEFTQSYSRKQTKGNKLDLRKIDLKEHHGVLGTTSHGYYTTSSGFYKAEKPKEGVKDQGSDIAKNLRKHHFKLGNEEGVQSSCFTIDYKERKGERAIGNSELASGTWNSHFSFGQGHRVYKSTSQFEFEHRPPKSTQGQFRNHSKLNFTFGSTNQSLSTTHNQSFVPKPTTPTQSNSMDLRSSHFTLGSFPANFSQTSSQPVPQPSDFTPATEPLISIQASHFSLGTDKSSFMTSSNQNLRSSTPAPSLKVNSQQHLSSSFSFGNSQTPLSISHHSYKHPVPGIPSSASTHLIKDLKAHHFKLGEEGGADFKTSNSVLGNKPGVPGKFEEGLWKDLRNSHFEIHGKGKPQFLSVQKKDFCEFKVEKEDFSGLAKGLRKSHFANGDSKGTWSTEQKRQFNWIRPVPDNDYKPTPV